MPPTVTKQSPKPILAGKPSVIDRIAPIGFDEDDGIKVLLYGRSGTGKTSLASTFPGPILWVICSGSDKPGELRSIDTPEHRARVKQVVLHHSSELRDLVEYVDESSDSGKFNTVVLDHATGFQDLVLKEILGLDELPPQKAWGLASQQQYGQCTLQCKELLRALLSLSCNVVIVAQEREFNTDNESDLITPYVGAGLTPSLAGWLNTAVEYICQTFIRQKMETKKTTVGQGAQSKTIETQVVGKGVEYCTRTGPHSTFTTKFRVPRGTPLPDTLVDADYMKIMGLIRGKLSPKERTK